MFQDMTVRIWDTVLSQCTLCISGHLQSITCVKWGGTDLIYTSSQDRTIKVWKGENVSPPKSLYNYVVVMKIKIVNKAARLYPFKV